MITTSKSAERVGLNPVFQYCEHKIDFSRAGELRESCKNLAGGKEIKAKHQQSVKAFSFLAL